MKKPTNWENVRPAGEGFQLPVGAYICRALGAKEVTYQGRDGGTFDKLEIAFDITEGEFAGFYADEFDNQRQEDRRWKGVLRYYLPKDDGTEQDEWTQRSLKALVEAFEDSNPSYHWDWENPASLKDKAIGVLFRNEEWAFEGRSGWKAQPFKGIAVEKVRGGKFKLPSPKPLKNKPASAGFEEVDEGEVGDLPF